LKKLIFWVVIIILGAAAYFYFTGTPLPAQVAELLPPEIASKFNTSATYNVVIKNLSFSPENITAKVGDKIVWKNEDEEEHSVVSSGITFESSMLAKGESFEYVLKAPGTYSYFCSLHPQMTGTIVVSE